MTYSVFRLVDLTVTGSSATELSVENAPITINSVSVNDKPKLVWIRPYEIVSTVQSAIRALLFQTCKFGTSAAPVHNTFDVVIQQHNVTKAKFSCDCCLSHVGYVGGFWQGWHEFWEWWVAQL